MEQRERQVAVHRCEEGEGVPRREKRENRMGTEPEREERGRTVTGEAAGGFGEKGSGEASHEGGAALGGLTSQRRTLLLGWKQWETVRGP